MSDLKKIEKRRPRGVANSLSWCGHLGDNQMGCIRCAISRQDALLDRLHADVVKLARALDEAAKVLRKQNWRESARRAERTLKELAGE